jgi:hypothetical protein
MYNLHGKRSSALILSAPSNKASQTSHDSPFRLLVSYFVLLSRKFSNSWWGSMYKWFLSCLWAGKELKLLDVGSRKVANLKFISSISDFCCPFQNCNVKVIFWRWPNFLFANSEIYINVTADFLFVSYLCSTFELSSVRAKFIRAVNYCAIHREQPIFCHLRIWGFYWYNYENYASQCAGFIRYGAWFYIWLSKWI